MFRHTCLTRLREAGMALEAVQAQAGHRTIESTRIYLHLSNNWLSGEYRRDRFEAINATGQRGPLDTAAPSDPGQRPGGTLRLRDCAAGLTMATRTRTQADRTFMASIHRRKDSRNCGEPQQVVPRS